MPMVVDVKFLFLQQIPKIFPEKKKKKQTLNILSNFQEWWWSSAHYIIAQELVGRFSHGYSSVSFGVVELITKTKIQILVAVVWKFQPLQYRSAFL